MVKIRGPLEIAGIEVLGSLPLTDNFEGRMVQVGSQIFVFQNGVYDRVSFPPQDPLLTDGAVLVSDGDDVVWLKPTDDKQILGSVGEEATWRDQYPDHGGHEDHVLRSDGIDNVIWSPQYPTLLNGKFLTNDGTDVLWGDIPGQLPTPLPGIDDGKYLRFDGTNVLWQAVVRADLEAQTPGWVLINDPTPGPTLGRMSEEQYLAQVRGGFGQDATLLSGAAGFIKSDGAGTFLSDTVTVSDLPTTGIPASYIEDSSVDGTEFKRLNEFGRVLSTGIISGSVLSINATPSLFDLSLGVGEIIDYTVPGTPTITRVPSGPFTGVTVTNLATADVTHILINAAGAIIQQTTFPTPAEQRDNIYIGRLNHSSRTSIAFADTTGGTGQSIANQYADLLDALGPFNIEGNTPQTNGPNLTLSRSAGTMFSRYFNRTTFPKNPHGIPVAGQTPMQFAYRTQQGGSTAPVTNVDPLNWDNGVSATPVPIMVPPNPTSVAQIQRIYLFPSGETRIQYGQTLYTNLAAALDALPSEVHVKAPTVQGFGILIGYVVVQRNCTDLTEADRARVIPAARFDIGVGGGGSVSSTTLQQAYLNGFIPHITLTPTGGGVTIRDASPSIGDTDPNVLPLFRVQNNAGTVDYLNVSTDGVRFTKRALAPTPAPNPNPPGTVQTLLEGTMWYDTTDKVMRYYTNRPDSINIGMEVNVLVRNASGSPMIAGQVVRITGAVSGVPTVLLAQADLFANSKTFAVITEAIANNSNGLATICGRINRLNLSGSLYGETFNDGDYLFLSTTIAGGLTKVRPSAPYYAQSIGSVISNHSSQGVLSVDFGSFRRIGNGANNQLRGMGTAVLPALPDEEYKSLVGTANQINISHSPGQIQLSLDPLVTQLANANQPGNVAPRKGQKVLVNGDITQSAFTTFNIVRGVAIYYQDQDGNHRLKFNIVITWDSVAVGGVALGFVGVRFKNVTNYFQPITNFLFGSTTTNFKVYCDPSGAGNLIAISGGGVTASGIGLSGDVELDSKPTWA